MEYIYQQIFDTLSTTEYLNLRLVNNYYNDYICNNKFVC
jgi:hypothetical protein